MASFGTYGYELNLSEYSEGELEQFYKYSKEYGGCQALILKGDLYRLITPESGEFCAYLNISKDKSKALLTFLSLYTSGHVENMTIRLKGLDENKYYKNTKTGVVLSGGALMNVGIRMEDLFEDRSGSGRRILFIEV